MAPDPRTDSILAWQYRALAAEAQADARKTDDRRKRHVLEELAEHYLTLAAGDAPEASTRSRPAA